MLAIALGAIASPLDVLRRLHHATQIHQLPPPAALVGNWAHSRAVIAPSLQIIPIDPRNFFNETPHEYSHEQITQTSLKVGGGWIGYLSYPDQADPTQPARIPAAAAGWTNYVLRCDQHGCWWWESLSDESMPSWVAQALRYPCLSHPYHVQWHYPDADTHQHHIELCLEAIRSGEIYQACVCTQLHGVLTGEIIDVFCAAFAHTAPDKGAYLAGPWGAIGSLSPELFLARRNELVMSSPIKGTLPLHQHPHLLRSSTKDIAENIMIVDLVRNDLGRLAYPGSVTVKDLLTIRRASGVWHLISTVSAHLDPHIPTSSLLEATFPPASVTGTPKSRARQLLCEWESVNRGIYCGAIGLSSPLAGMELNVAIRTIESDSHGGVSFGVGGGITIDSDPYQEWQECLDKAQPIIQADHDRAGW